MKIEITEEKNQPLLERRVVKATLTFQGGTPTRKDVITNMAAQLKVKEELLVLKAIRTVFGRMKAVATVHVYKNKKQVEAVEPAYRLNRGKAKPKKEEKPAEAPKEEAKPAEEAPAEAPKEEKPAEEAPKEEKPAKEAKPEEAPKEEKPAENKKEAKPAKEKKKGE